MGSSNDGNESRYSRHRSLLSDAAWERLTNTRIILAGVGGLGSNVAQLVARLAPVRLELWDPAHVDAPDLNRQILYGADDIGAAKVERAAAALQRVNPEAAVVPHRAALDPAAFRAAYDPSGPGNGFIVMDCLDSFAARGGLEEIRREHGVPVVHAGIEGWFGQAALFPGGGAGYEAVYGPDYASRPPAGKPMMPPVVTAVAALEVQLLLEWAEEGYDREHPDALYIYDGKLHSLERIALDSPAQA